MALRFLCDGWSQNKRARQTERESEKTSAPEREERERTCDAHIRRHQQLLANLEHARRKTVRLPVCLEAASDRAWARARAHARTHAHTRTHTHTHEHARARAHTERDRACGRCYAESLALPGLNRSAPHLIRYPLFLLLHVSFRVKHADNAGSMVFHSPWISRSAARQRRMRLRAAAAAVCSGGTTLKPCTPPSPPSSRSPARVALHALSLHRALNLHRAGARRRSSPPALLPPARPLQGSLLRGCCTTDLAECWVRAECRGECRACAVRAGAPRRAGPRAVKLYTSTF